MSISREIYNVRSTIRIILPTIWCGSAIADSPASAVCHLYLPCDFSPRRFYADHKTSRFFSQHKVTSGAVIKYEVSDGNIYTTASQAVPGVSSIFVPRIHQTPSQFSIVLECHDGGVPFHARYEIPSEDFKAHKEGENIQIQEYWEPIEYQKLWHK